jgi:hypothetical protein
MDGRQHTVQVSAERRCRAARAALGAAFDTAWASTGGDGRATP